MAKFNPKPFGKYFLIEKLATGGMAEIYKAKTFGAEGFEKLLAIKRILPHCSEDKEFIHMLVDEAQVVPTHFHWLKMEDIINRSGGRLVLELWNADPDTEQLDEINEVTVSVDGVERTVPAGGKIILDPGESITLPPFMYHNFYAQTGRGMVLAGEVSRVNDDNRDNRFHTPLRRFATIEEDVPPRFLLCMEYPPAK